MNANTAKALRTAHTVADMNTCANNEATMKRGVK